MNKKTLIISIALSTFLFSSNIPKNALEFSNSKCVALYSTDIFNVLNDFANKNNLQKKMNISVLKSKTLDRVLEKKFPTVERVYSNKDIDNLNIFVKSKILKKFCDTVLNKKGSYTSLYNKDRIKKIKKIISLTPYDYFNQGTILNRYISQYVPDFLQKEDIKDRYIDDNIKAKLPFQLYSSLNNYSEQELDELINFLEKNKNEGKVFKKIILDSI